MARRWRPATRRSPRATAQPTADRRPGACVAGPSKRSRGCRETTSIVLPRLRPARDERGPLSVGVGRRIAGDGGCSAPESSRGPDAACAAIDCGRCRRPCVARAQRLLVERLPKATRLRRRGSLSPPSCGDGKEWHPRSAISESWGTRVSVRDHACAGAYEVRAGSTRRGRSGTRNHSSRPCRSRLTSGCCRSSAHSSGV